jgi:hypothetical protein
MIDMPPALYSQVPNFRTDISQSCPGFNSSDNQAISHAAINNLMSRYPELKNVSSGNIRILFTNQFLNLNSSGNWSAPGVPNSSEEQRLIRIRDYTSQIPSNEYRYIFFCPSGDSSDDWYDPPGFETMVISQIENWFDLPPGSLLRGSAIWDFFRIGKVSFNLKGGSLFYVRPSN